MLELSAIDSVRMDLILFHGGYSLGSSVHRTKLQNGKRYLIDGTQKVFLVAETQDSIGRQSFGKPYFSMAVKKVKGEAVAPATDIIDELEDTSILTRSMTVTPLLVQPDGTIEDSEPIPEHELDSSSSSDLVPRIETSKTNSA